MVEFLLLVLVPSLVLWAALWVAAGQPRPGGFIAGTLIVAFLLSAAFESPLLVGQVILSGFALLFFCALGSGVAVRRFAATAGAVAAVGCFICLGLIRDARETERLAMLREQFPLQPVTQRLAYEARRLPAASERAASDTSVTEPVALAPEVELNLQATEARARSSDRGRALAQLHRIDTDRNSTPFGRPQTFRFLNTAVSLPDPRSISLTEPPPRNGCATPSETPHDYVPQPSPTDSTTPFYALREFHDKGARDFLNPERFGHVQDREHVAGFEPHGFQSMPALGKHRSPEGEWSLEHLDLVSLLKPSGPHAYVSANLPKIEELKTADTRLLDDFETRALSQLRTNEDVVIEESDGVVRMVGALRAGNQCIQCHAARRGELIGAFSYELHRKTPGAHQTAQADGPPET